MLKPGEFTSMDDLENYAEYSHSSILYLLLETMEVKNETAEYAASHVGVCKGIVTLLRGYSHHASQVYVLINTHIFIFLLNLLFFLGNLLFSNSNYVEARLTASLGNSTPY